MANRGEPVRWITVKGKHLPVYEDGIIGIGFEHEKESNVDLIKEFESKRDEYANTPFEQVAKRNELREWLIKNQNAYHTQKLEQDKKVNNDSELSGEVSFADMMKLDTHKISFDKTVTYMFKGKNPAMSDNKKRDLTDRLNEYGINDVVVNMYRDKSGANDLKRMQDAGFEIQAYYKGESQGNIPARDYYYMKRKNISASNTVSRNARYDTSRSVIGNIADIDAKLNNARYNNSLSQEEIQKLKRKRDRLEKQLYKK